MNGKGLAHLLATIIVILIFLSTVISAIITILFAGAVSRVAQVTDTDDSGVVKGAGGAIMLYAGLSSAVAIIMGWLSYKMVKCEFKCD